MKVAILGTGAVGQSLAKGFADLGHQVIIGTRDAAADKAKAAVTAVGRNVTGATFADAAKQADIAVLATVWTGAENALKLAGADNLAGKLVIDVTNPLDLSAGTPRLAVGHSDSAGEQVQRWLPKSKVVKAFNIITAAHMVKPKIAGGPPTMFIAGNDAEAKQKVAEYLTAFGWEDIVDIGGIEGARLLEPLAMLWITYGFRTNTWTHAFRLLRAQA